MANLVLAGCAASPADDRRQLTPTKLRDGGRPGDDDDDHGEEDDVPAARPVRDAGSDARVPGTARPADAGRAETAVAPRDAGTRVDAAVVVDAGAPAPPAPAPTSAQPQPTTTVPTSVSTSAPSDPGPGRTRGGSRDEDEDDEEEDERASQAPGRTRDAGGPMMPTTPTGPAPGPGGPAQPINCWTGRQCQPTACKQYEEPCCRTNGLTCGCRERFSLLCR